MKRILNYFLSGLLITFPVGATLYILYALVTWLNGVFNSIVNQFIGIDIPGLGIILAFVAISLLGFMCAQTFTRPIVNLFERLLSRMPMVNIIYSSLRDLTEALVGEEKKFNKPVLVELGSGLKRFGFITQNSLQQFGLENQVAVYCPHSYNFSGNLYIVDKDQVKPLNVDATEFMRFTVSGGVTKMENLPRKI